MDLSGQSQVSLRSTVLTAIVLVLALAGIISTPALARDTGGLTPSGQALMEAAYAGRLNAVQSLLSQGVPPDTTDSEKHTPLMWAAFNGHTSVVRLLLDKGATLDAKDENGRCALMYASSGPFAETVEVLLDEGSKVDVQGTLEGFTALMTAAAEGQIEVVRLLLAHGADPALKDKDGDTAESFARQNGHAAVVELLKNPPLPEKGRD